MKAVLLCIGCAVAGTVLAQEPPPNSVGYIYKTIKIATAPPITGVQRYIGVRRDDESQRWFQQALALERDGGADPGAIFKLYEKAAAAGNPNAQWALGEVYMQGRLAPRDERAGLELLTKAATAGVAEAQYDLGYIYANGIGVAPDTERAAAEYGRAADLGLLKARVNLALLLSARAKDGDLERAYVLLRVAERQGFTGAKGNLSELAAQLSPEARTRADQRARAQAIQPD